jgi:tRNA threonylcarbamoyladenosine biosynthesis protein TsaE
VVDSPTFVIMKVYPLADNKKGIKELCHLDTYRLSSPEEVVNIGLKDYLNNPEAVIVVEWPEKIRDILPGSTIFVKMEFENENNRKIVIKHY